MVQIFVYSVVIKSHQEYLRINSFVLLRCIRLYADRYLNMKLYFMISFLVGISYVYEMTQ